MEWLIYLILCFVMCCCCVVFATTHLCEQIWTSRRVAGQHGDETSDNLSAKLTNATNFRTTNAGLVANDLDLSDDTDDSSSSFYDAEDDEDDSQERLDRPHSRPVETQSLPNSLMTNLDDDPDIDIDDAILEKAVSENFKKVPRLDLDSALLDDPEKLKHHDDALNFGSISPLIPPTEAEDFNFNMLQIPTFEENSMSEDIIGKKAIFTLAKEHDYCIPSALKRTSSLPSSGMENRSYPHSNGRPSSSRSPSPKFLKACQPSAKKSSPKKRRRSSSSSSSSSGFSSYGKNCGSCFSSSSDSETESRKHNQSKSSKSKHDKHESKSKISQPVRKPRKQAFRKVPKLAKQHKPKPPPTKTLEANNLSYAVERVEQQPRLEVCNVPITQLLTIKQELGSEITEDDDKSWFMDLDGDNPLIGSQPLQTSQETNSTSNVITISRGLPNAAIAAPASALVFGKKRKFPSAGPMSSPISKNMKDVSGESGSAASPKQTGAQGKLNNVSAKGEKLLKDSPISSASSSSSSLTKKTRGMPKKVTMAEVPDEKLYCFCQSPHDTVSQMIGCDDKDCEYQWFHFECVGIVIPPKGKWFCSDCREKRRNKYMKMSRKNDLVLSPRAFTSGSIPNKESGSL